MKRLVLYSLILLSMVPVDDSLGAEEPAPTQAPTQGAKKKPRHRRPRHLTSSQNFPASELPPQINPRACAETQTTPAASPTRGTRVVPLKELEDCSSMYSVKLHVTPSEGLPPSIISAPSHESDRPLTCLDKVKLFFKMRHRQINYDDFEGIGEKPVVVTQATVVVERKPIKTPCTCFKEWLESRRKKEVVPAFAQEWQAEGAKDSKEEERKLDVVSEAPPSTADAPPPVPGPAPSGDRRSWLTRLLERLKRTTTSVPPKKKKYILDDSDGDGFFEEMISSSSKPRDYTTL